MTNCFACGMGFTVEFEDEDAEARFCPYCGQESVDDISLLEDQGDIDPDLIYDDDDMDL